MSDWGEPVVLGRSGLRVSRLGVGSSYGVSVRACHRAFDAGVNYFFWGSFRSPKMGAAIRDIARTRRDDLVIVLQCYARWPFLIRRSVEQGLRQLGIDRADVLLLGWHETAPSNAVLDTVQQLREQGRLIQELGDIVAPATAVPPAHERRPLRRISRSVQRGAPRCGE